MTAVITAEASAGKLTRARSSRLGIPGVVAVVVLVLAVAAAIAGPYLAPYDPSAGSPSGAWLGPSSGHLLGQDVQGRDVASRLLAGARSSMLGPLIVVVLSLVMGSVLALLAAWRRGVIDSIISSTMDILFAFPGILLAALAAAVLDAGLWAAVIALSVAYTPYVARLLRGVFLRERELPYVAAAEIQGFSAITICLRHLIPNVLPVMVAQGTLLFGYAVLDIAILSYLGLGIQPPSPDWGVMVSENQSGVLQSYPLPVLSAGCCVVVVVVAMNILGERLLGAKDNER